MRQRRQSPLLRYARLHLHIVPGVVDGSSGRYDAAILLLRPFPFICWASEAAVNRCFHICTTKLIAAVGHCRGNHFAVSALCRHCADCLKGYGGFHCLVAYRCYLAFIADVGLYNVPM